MMVKATGLLARKRMVAGEFGADEWARFFEDFARKEPFFRRVLLATTLIPVEIYVKINEALIQKFYGGDSQAHWRFGEKSAEWAFEEGPYKTIFFSGDFKRFLADVPAIFKTYYTEGEARIRHHENVLDVWLDSIPFPHVYFEYTVMGYIKRGLQLTGARGLVFTAVRAFSLGHPDVHYRFNVEGAGGP